VSAEQARRALRELGRLEAHIINAMRAAGAAGLDVATLGHMLTEATDYARRAREQLNWPPPLHPRCGQRHDPSEPCPAPEGR
jgi:hypothetical protein